MNIKLIFPILLLICTIGGCVWCVNLSYKEAIVCTGHVKDKRMESGYWDSDRFSNWHNIPQYYVTIQGWNGKYFEWRIPKAMYDTLKELDTISIYSNYPRHQ